MRSGGFEYQCLGVAGPQTMGKAFAFLQEKLGESDVVDYKGYRIEKDRYVDDQETQYVVITAKNNNKQAVSFSTVSSMDRSGIHGYAFGVSRDDSPKALGSNDWIDLHSGACEQGVKTLLAVDNPKFRQMDRAELGAYAYLFATGLETLDYHPGIDYEYLVTRCKYLMEQISNPDPNSFGGVSLFTRPESKERVRVDAFGELIETLETLEKSAALPPEAREVVNKVILTIAYKLEGESLERAEELAESAIIVNRFFKNVAIATEEK